MTKSIRGILPAAVFTAAALLGVGGLAAAGPAHAAPGVSDISQGSGNRAGVRCVQHGVNNWAQRTGKGRPLEEDGLFGKATAKWVEKFQGASDLDIDAIVGKNTGNSILDNLTGDGNWRADCYKHIPSTRR
ncbi:peptidoglycan-binding protein [Streptomyces sp. NPDC059650]|uniref:peptidoglycan-binding domain-containing protein n=1 Tax=Streptomyces sp. NPDC059650 TaxID=3346896 RepID=UPI00368D9568